MKKFLSGLIISLVLVSQVFADQHDYIISNAPGVTVRADINSVLQSIVTNNSGATEPSTTYPNMWWYDTSTSTLKRRNNANTAWIVMTSGTPIATAGGTVDAITADFSPDVTLTNLTLVAVVASGANTSTTPTFAPDGLTAHTIVKKGGNTLAVGDIPAAGFVMLLEYNLANTRWELLNSANVVSADGTVNPNNLLFNYSFEGWSAGASSVPDGWTLGGAGASVARESSTIKMGTYSVKVTAGVGDDAEVYQDIHAERGINYWKGKTITVTGNVRNSYLQILDGVGITTSSAPTADTWVSKTITRTIDASADKVRIHVCHIPAPGSTGYADGVIACEGSSAFAPSPKFPEEGVWADYGAVSTITGWSSFTDKNIYCKKVGKLVFVKFWIYGTSNATSASFTLPYTSSNTLSTYSPLGYTYDNNNAKATPGLLSLSSNASTVNCYPDSTNASTWTSSNGKIVAGTFWYETSN